MTTIGDNLQSVRTRIATACAAAGRRADSVALLAVSKTFGPEAVREAPKMEQVWCELSSLVDGQVLVAHNARFDIGVLVARSTLMMVSSALTWPPLCTSR